MIHIRMIEQPEDKTSITLHVMHALPAWFSPPEDIDQKAILHKDYPFFVAYQEESPIGFVALKIHNPYTAEIFNMGVLEAHHRQGAGRLLIAAAEQYCYRNGYQVLTVKTLDSSADYEPYDRTRAFYTIMGFIPLEIFTTYWNAENPCLFLAKWLDITHE